MYWSLSRQPSDQELFLSWPSYLCMAFAQLTYRERVSGILKLAFVPARRSCITSASGAEYREAPLQRQTKNGTGECMPTSAKFWFLKHAPFMPMKTSGIELKETAYALDSTTIDLCLSLFPWASFRKLLRPLSKCSYSLGSSRKHPLVHPEITEGTLHDVNILDILVPEPGSFYIMDRGYLDFERLYVFTQLLAFFVTRTKEKTPRSGESVFPSGGSNRRPSIRPDSNAGYAQITGGLFPEQLRRVKYFDAEREKLLVFLTNNFVLPALNYYQTLQVPMANRIVLLKWIKQHLRIKAFYGTSDNAVKNSDLDRCFYLRPCCHHPKTPPLGDEISTQFLQILSVTLFEKVSLDQLFANYDYKKNTGFQRTLYNQTKFYFDY